MLKNETHVTIESVKPTETNVKHIKLFRERKRVKSEKLVSFEERSFDGAPITNIFKAINHSRRLKIQRHLFSFANFYSIQTRLFRI